MDALFERSLDLARHGKAAEHVSCRACRMRELAIPMAQRTADDLDAGCSGT